MSKPTVQNRQGFAERSRTMPSASLGEPATGGGAGFCMLPGRHWWLVVGRKCILILMNGCIAVYKD